MRRFHTADTIGLVVRPKTKSNPLGAGRSPRAGGAASAHVAVRLTMDEHQRWKAAAAASDLSLAEWIRAACEARLPKRKRG
jgi:hypothetical protein